MCIKRPNILKFQYLSCKTTKSRIINNLQAGKIFKPQGVDKESRQTQGFTQEELEVTKDLLTYRGWELDDMNLDEKVTELLKNYRKITLTKLKICIEDNKKLHQIYVIILRY